MKFILYTLLDIIIFTSYC